MHAWKEMEREREGGERPLICMWPYTTATCTLYVYYVSRAQASRCVYPYPLISTCPPCTHRVKWTSDNPLHPFSIWHLHVRVHAHMHCCVAIECVDVCGAYSVKAYNVHVHCSALVQQTSPSSLCIVCELVSHVLMNVLFFSFLFEYSCTFVCACAYILKLNRFARIPTSWKGEREHEQCMYLYVCVCVCMCVVSLLPSLFPNAPYLLAVWPCDLLRVVALHCAVSTSIILFFFVMCTN